MVTVSNNLMSYVNKPAVSGVNSAQNIEKNFGVNPQDKKERTQKVYKEDTLLDNSFSNKLRLNWEKTKSIPLKHFPRGLGGAQDYTFFEFLQTAKFPYYVGGPVLAALFYAGMSKNNFQSAKAAKTVAKHIATGVALYYVGAALAKSVVNTTVRLARGVDLNHPYAKAVPTETNKTGMFKRDTEFHRVTESADFTRWDLLYKKEGKTPEEINETYAKFAKKYGIKSDANDVDSTVKPLIKKTIIMSRAWQYALTAAYVTLGIGMANQEAWKKESLEGFRRTLSAGVFGMPNLRKALVNAKNKVAALAPDAAGLGDKAKVYKDEFKEYAKGLLGGFKELKNAAKSESIKNIKNTRIVRNIKSRMHNLKVAFYDYAIKPFGLSFSQFWKSSFAGKATILTAGVATVTAILLLMGKTTGRFHKIVKPEDKTNEVANK